jgi:hypothetical protein
LLIYNMYVMYVPVFDDTLLFYVSMIMVALCIGGTYPCHLCSLLFAGN